LLRSLITSPENKAIFSENDPVAGVIGVSRMSISLFPEICPDFYVVNVFNVSGFHPVNTLPTAY
jgi:hypothetical protein